MIQASPISFQRTRSDFWKYTALKYIQERVFYDTLEGRKFTIRIEEAPEGGYTGQCMELPGAISEGDTIEELKANMTEVIELVLESLE